MCLDNGHLLLLSTADNLHFGRQINSDKSGWAQHNGYMYDVMCMDDVNRYGKCPGNAILYFKSSKL